MNTDNDLRQDLSLALHMITETNQLIRFADTKAGALAGVQALMITVLTARDGTTFRSLQVACFLGVLLSALLLAAGQVPRVFENRERPSRASFPALARLEAGQLHELPCLKAQHEDAWCQAASVARIAVVKFCWLTRAAASTAVTLAAVLVWLACVTWSSSAG